MSLTQSYDRTHVHLSSPSPMTLAVPDADPATSRPRLSVIMAAHNEDRTIGRVVKDILSLDVAFDVELVVVDDGSSDRTPIILRQFEDERLVVHRHPNNLGKGAAVLSGAGLATGTHLVVFDADDEYLASDLAAMFLPILRGRADVVYGTRMFGMNTVYQSFRYAIGNRITTLAANVLFDACLTDLHTCLKMMPLRLFRELDLEQKGFGLDSEITAELLRRGHRPFEVPVSYHSRSHAQGKKITWRDGVECLFVLGKVRLRRKSDIRVAPRRLAATAGRAQDDVELRATEMPAGLEMDLRTEKNDGAVAAHD